MARKELDPGDITIICDSREQLPFCLDPMRVIRTEEGKGLATGDYTVLGLERVVCVERKSMDDLIGCVGVERERFDREMMRIKAYPHRVVIVEASWSELEKGAWRSRVTAAAAVGSVIGWIAGGVPFIFAGSRSAAERACMSFLFHAARSRWREAATLIPTLKIDTRKTDGTQDA